MKNKKSLLGKFIRCEWNNGDYRNVWIRRVTRETPTQYIADVQRYVKSWDVPEKKYQYIFVPDWAQRFDKTSNGIRKRGTHLDNPDGKMILRVVDDLTTLKCEFTYDDLFKTDVREFQPVGAYPRASMERMEEVYIKRGNFDSSDHYLIDSGIKLKSSIAKTGKNLEHIETWDAPVIKYLENVFKVPVYCNILYKIIEHDELSKLTKSGTFMHINHFGDDKKFITSDENYFNRTILFWLFEDKLVFQYCDGINTW